MSRVYVTTNMNLLNQLQTLIHQYCHQQSISVEYQHPYHSVDTVQTPVRYSSLHHTLTSAQIVITRNEKIKKIGKDQNIVPNYDPHQGNQHIRHKQILMTSLVSLRRWIKTNWNEGDVRHSIACLLSETPNIWTKPTYTSLSFLPATTTTSTKM